MKQKEQFTVYKVCKVTKDNKTVSSHAYGEAQVTYEIGKKSFPVEFTKELGYGLFAFENLNDAIDECHNYHYINVIILICLTEKYKKKIATLPLDLDHLSIGETFSYIPKGKDILGFTKFPKGTIMCDWLLPVEIVRVVNIGEIK